MKNRGFTVIELLVVISIIGILSAIVVPVMGAIKRKAAIAVSSSNLKALVMANYDYAADNDGYFSPATSRNNNVRWHGSRANRSGVFEAKEGFLTPYFGESEKVLTCPIFDELLAKEGFDSGAGAFGYNSIYIGGTPQDSFAPIKTVQLTRPGHTVMFASTALAVNGGIQEYPFVEPQSWIDPNGNAGGSMQPSIHFRYGGKALVAWGDGRVTLETPNDATGPNYYGGDNSEQLLGWFGPNKDNGYLNPQFEP